MRLLIIVAFLLANHVLNAQVLLEVYEDSLRAFSYAGGDEFNGRELNADQWKNGLGGRRVLMVQDLAFEPDNVQFKNGNIVFIADKNDTVYALTQWEVDSNYMRKRNIGLRENRFPVKYSAGAIVSKNKYHYGLYELRFKVEEGRGIWPAFWFYGGNKNEEIDVFEMKGERNNDIHVDTHCPSGCAHGYKKTKMSFPRSYGSWIRMSDFLHAGYNNVMLDWRENELIWYINGFPFAYFRGMFSNPMNLFLNTSVAKTGEGFSPGPDSTTSWPNKYYVDFLRIWMPAENHDTLVLKTGDFHNSNEFADVEITPSKRRGVAYSRKRMSQLKGIISITRPEKNTIAIKTLGCMNRTGYKVFLHRSEARNEIIPTSAQKSINLKEGERLITLELIRGTKSLKKIIKLQ